MKIRMLAIVAGASLAASMAVSANEVVVTPVATKSSQLALGFDIVSSGDVAGFNFKVAIPGLSDKAGNVASCVAELPKGFDGACSVTKGGVYVYATSSSSDVSLPAGMVSIGKIVLNYEGAAKVGGQVKPVVEELAMFDNQGKALTAKAQVVGSDTAAKPARNRTAAE